MMVLVAAAAALAAASGAPATGSPRAGTLDFDVQCMLAIQQATARADAPTKAKLAILAMFYFGRVDSAASGDPLKQRFRTAAKRMEGVQLAPLVRTCGAFMNGRTQAIANMGESLNAELKASPAR